MFSLVIMIWKMAQNNHAKLSVPRDHMFDFNYPTLSFYIGEVLDSHYKLCRYFPFENEWEYIFQTKKHFARISDFLLQKNLNLRNYD